MENKNIRVYRNRLTAQSFSRKYFFFSNVKLCLVCKGGAVWEIGGKCYNIKKGDVVVLNSRQQRIFKEISLTEGIELLIVEFEPQLFIRQFQSLFSSDKVAFNCVLTEQSELVRLFEEIEQEKLKSNSYYKIIIGAKLLEILSLLGRYYKIEENNYFKMNEEVYRAVEYVDENFTKDVSLQKAADVIHISSSSLSKNFSKCVGMGFAQYVMHKRVNRAIQLLQSSDKTVLEIALDCGFHNAASFYKAFKKITHLNPKDYRILGEEFHI